MSLLSTELKEFPGSSHLREPHITSAASGEQFISPTSNRLQHILESSRFSTEYERKSHSVRHSTSYSNLEDMNDDDFKSEDYEAEEDIYEDESLKDRPSIGFVKVDSLRFVHCREEKQRVVLVWNEMCDRFRYRIR